MSRFVLVAVVGLSILPLLAVDASARGWRRVAAPAPAATGYSYRSYSYEPQDCRPPALRRAPYTVQSNIWRGDRKMFQTYWYRETWRP